MSSRHGSDARFTPTHWSVVLAATRWPESAAQDALARLCESYWYPLYAFLRRQGRDPHDAQDLTQSFFAHLFERGALQRVDRAKGSFRSFLLGALDYFLKDEHDRQMTVKRGGRCTFVAWDDAAAEDQFRLDAAFDGPAEAHFDRRWALALLHHVFARLEREYAAAGRARVFSVLQSYLTTDTAASCADAARRLQMSEGATRVALHRLRRRFGEMVRAEVAQTVVRPEDVEGELRHLFAALAQ